MIRDLTANFRNTSIGTAVLFALLLLCSTVDFPRNWTFAGTTFLGAATLAGCGIIWIVFFLKPEVPNSLLRTVLFLILFELYASSTLVWAHTGVDGVQVLVVGLAFLGVILVTARETGSNPRTAHALHLLLLALSSIAIGMYGLVIVQESKLGDGVLGIITNRAFALYALVVVAVALANWRKIHTSRWQALIPLTWACIVTLTVAMSMSRTALVCCLLLFPLAILLRLDAKSVAASIFMLGGGGTLFGVAVMSYKPLYDRFFGFDNSMKVGGVALNASGRTKIWELLLHSIRDNWIFGNGVASSQILVRNSIPGVGQPHNDYLRYYYDTGAVGLSLYLCFALSFVLTTIGNLRRSLRNQTPDTPMHVAALLAFAAVSWSMLTDNPVCYSFVMLPLAVVMGCSLGTGQAARPMPVLQSEHDYFAHLAQPLGRNIRIVS